jgi:hypothetical protein
MCFIVEVDAEESSSSDDEEYREEITPGANGGIIEKLYNSKNLKKIENHYDIKVIDGLEKKCITRSIHFNNKG